MFQWIKNLFGGKSLASIVSDLEGKLADLTTHAEKKAQEVAKAVEDKEHATAAFLEERLKAEAAHAAKVTGFDTLAETAQAEADRAKAIAGNLSALLAK